MLTGARPCGASGRRRVFTARACCNALLRAAMNRVMVATGQKRGATRRAKRGRMEAVVAETFVSELLKRGRIDRPFLGDVMRSMPRAWSPIDKERFVRGRRFLHADPRDSLLRHRLGEMPLIVSGRLFARRGVLDEGRVPVIGLAAHEAPEIFEPQPRGPPVEWSGGACLVVRRVMPFAERRRVVTILFQNLRDERRVLGSSPS